MDYQLSINFLNFHQNNDHSFESLKNLYDNIDFDKRILFIDRINKNIMFKYPPSEQFNKLSNNERQFLHYQYFFKLFCSLENNHQFNTQDPEMFYFILEKKPLEYQYNTKKINHFFKDPISSLMSQFFLYCDRNYFLNINTYHYYINKKDMFLANINYIHVLIRKHQQEDYSDIFEDAKKNYVFRDLLKSKNLIQTIDKNKNDLPEFGHYKYLSMNIQPMINKLNTNKQKLYQNNFLKYSQKLKESLPFEMNSYISIDEMQARIVFEFPESFDLHHYKDYFFEIIKNSKNDFFQLDQSIVDLHIKNISNIYDQQKIISQIEIKEISKNFIKKL